MQLPWYLLVAFGSYSLWCIGYNLFMFRDCPEASLELADVGDAGWWWLVLVRAGLLA
jgi:dolichyl-phosphate mannosyltransferase polypeptide 3